MKSGLIEFFWILTACTCNIIGAESLCAHDSNSGKCRCKPAVTGVECTECKTGYWGFGEEKTIGCKSKVSFG